MRSLARLFSGLLLMFFFSTTVSAEEMKVAYVDVAKVFDEYQKTKENDRVLQESGKKKEEERDGLVKEIRAIKDEMVLLSDDAKAKKQETMQGKMQELQTFDQGARQALGDQRNKVVKEIFKDIDDTVQRYGERQGMDMILNERALLYHSPKLDITSTIINELNSNYGKKH